MPMVPPGVAAYRFNEAGAIMPRSGGSSPSADRIDVVVLQ